MNWLLKTLCGFLMVFVMCGTPKAHAGNDPDYLTVSAGWFDLNRKKDEGAEFRLNIVLIISYGNLSRLPL